MVKYAAVTIIVLLNGIGVGSVWGSTAPKDIKISGDILVKWPTEHNGKAVVPNGVRHIADYAFMDCNGVTDVVFPDGIRTIGESAFSRCFGLSEITIPASVTNIGDSAFFLCWNLTNLTIDAEVPYIPRMMCQTCVRLNSIKLPRKLLDIGEESFLSCRSLKAVVVPDDVTNIAENAFGGCARLAKISLPKRLKSIGSNAFSGCYDLDVSDISTQLGRKEFVSRSVADSSIGGLDRILRVAADEFIAEGYPNYVDIFALDRLIAHVNEIRVGMTFSEVDEFIRRYRIRFAHGARVDIDGQRVHESTRLTFNWSSHGAIYLALYYDDETVVGIGLSEAFKIAAKSGIMKSSKRINEADARWLE